MIDINIIFTYNIFIYSKVSENIFPITVKIITCKVMYKYLKSANKIF